MLHHVITIQQVVTCDYDSTCTFSGCSISISGRQAVCQPTNIEKNVSRNT